MLFDLRGRGRRRSVQAIYLVLAVILGGGFVLLGIGTSGGGLLDAFKGGNGSGTSADKVLDGQLASAAKVVKAKPRDPAAWANLSRLRIRLANVTGYQSDTGKQKLGLAYDAWERYLALNPPKPDVGLAILIAKAFEEQSLNEPKKAVRALEVFTAQTKPPNSNAYALLSKTAYQAGQASLGDLARDKAVALAQPSQKAAIRGSLKLEKTKAASGAGGGAGPTTTTSGQ